MHAAVVLQALPDQVDVVGELARGTVALGAVFQRRLQARGHQVDQQAVRHVRMARAGGGGGLGQQPAVALDLRQHLRIDPDDAGGLAQHVGQLLQLGAVPAQDRAALRVERAADGGRVDIRVAVHVAADPGAEAHQPRQVGGDAEVLADGVVQGLVEHRHHPVQHLGEVEAHVLALILHARAHRRGIGGLPGRRQGHAEAGQVGGAFAGRACAVEVVDQRRDHDLFLLQQRAPHRLGRVGGEHRLDIDAFQPVAQLVGRDGLALQAQQRIVQALRLWRPGIGALVVAAAADAMHAFGDVDHLEVRAEGTHQRLGVRRLQPVEQRRQRFHRPAVLAPRDRGGAHPLDLLEEGRRNLFGKHVADQRAEATHVVAQGQVRWGEFELAGSVHRHARQEWKATSELSRVLCGAAKVSAAPDPARPEAGPPPRPPGATRFIHRSRWTDIMRAARRGALRPWTCGSSAEPHFVWLRSTARLGMALPRQRRPATARPRLAIDPEQP